MQNSNGVVTLLRLDFPFRRPFTITLHDTCSSDRLEYASRFPVYYFWLNLNPLIVSLYVHADLSRITAGRDFGPTLVVGFLAAVLPLRAIMAAIILSGTPPSSGREGRQRRASTCRLGVHRLHYEIFA